MKKFVFTCGDINGIGPEIAIKALNKVVPHNKQSQFILIIPKNVFENSSRLVKPKFDFIVRDKLKLDTELSSQVIIYLLKSHQQTLGKPTVHSGKTAYDALKISYELLKDTIVDAVVTAPVSKTALRMAGVNYPGQTEMFADWCGTKNFVMTFLSNKIRVGLYSIHIPLNKVSNSLNSIEIQNKLEILINMMKKDLRIKNPRIAVLGLNPHAGENGIIGEEEKKIILPAINKIKSKSIIEGPFSSDAFFANRIFKNYDMVFGLYHDQVLIPFKFINAGKGVNFSAGLPIIRTSPDHGVAYDIAGKRIADESSMVEAFNYAKLILKNRRATSHQL